MLTQSSTLCVHRALLIPETKTLHPLNNTLQCPFANTILLPVSMNSTLLGLEPNGVQVCESTTFGFSFTCWTLGMFLLPAEVDNIAMILVKLAKGIWSVLTQTVLD